jgi:putative nucleotidyltransferase with HDIG domain
MAIQLNADNFGKLVDPFNGIKDLKNKIIRTPVDPDTTFSDDPLRMLRAVRFMCKLDFGIDQKTQDGIIRNVDRLDIISAERITTEFMKIMASEHAKDGIEILKNFGLLKKFLPELVEMDTTGASTVSEYVRGHKNIFWHTLHVLENVAQQTDNAWLRIASLFHDIGKMKTRSWNVYKGWSFDNHEYVGAKMIKSIFSRMKMPLDENMDFVETMVRMHMRPQAICDEGVTDAAVRRLVNDANGYIDELLILAKADITTKHEERKKNFWKQYDELKQRIEDLKQKDYVRLFQPCISGDDIMIRYHLTPSRQVGEIKQLIKDAVLDNIVENTSDALYKFIDEHYKF